MIYFIIIALSAFFITLTLGVNKKRRLGHLERSLGMSLFLVRLPRYESSEKEEVGNFREMIAKVEQLYANFLSVDKGVGKIQGFFKGYPRVAFEIASELGGSDISFYIAVPEELEGALINIFKVYRSSLGENIR